MFKNMAPNPVTESVIKLLDSAMVAKRSSQARRNYLGASQWGNECDRMLGFMYHGTKPDSDIPIRILRIFDMGHDGESRMGEYLKLAGFHLFTAGKDGKQFGFSQAGDRLKGHIDGVIVGGPDEVGIDWPALWENKALNDNGFNDCIKRGIKIARPLYYAQAQVYMSYMELQVCLFTIQNRNTGEVHAEIIPFSIYDAQRASDRAVRAINSNSPFELPRGAEESTWKICKFCDFRTTCWSIKPEPTEPPTWLKK